MKNIKCIIDEKVINLLNGKIYKFNTKLADELHIPIRIIIKKYKQVSSLNNKDIKIICKLLKNESAITDFHREEDIYEVILNKFIK